MLAPTSLEAYSSCLNTEFTVRLENGPPRIFTLTAAKSRIDDEVQTCFSLLFLGPGDVLPQQLHNVSHPQLGEFPLFLVPIQKRRAGVLYEAVFNLLKDEAR